MKHTARQILPHLFRNLSASVPFLPNGGLPMAILSDAFGIGKSYMKSCCTTSSSSGSKSYANAFWSWDEKAPFPADGSSVGSVARFTPRTLLALEINAYAVVLLV